MDTFTKLAVLASATLCSGQGFLIWSGDTTRQQFGPLQFGGQQFPSQQSQQFGQQQFGPQQQQFGPQQFGSPFGGLQQFASQQTLQFGQQQFGPQQQQFEPQLQFGPFGGPQQFASQQSQQQFGPQQQPFGSQQFRPQQFGQGQFNGQQFPPQYVRGQGGVLGAVRLQFIDPQQQIGPQQFGGSQQQFGGQQLGAVGQQIGMGQQIDCVCPDGSAPAFASFPPCSGGRPQGSSCPAPPGQGGMMGSIMGGQGGLRGFDGQDMGDLRGVMGGSGGIQFSGQQFGGQQFGGQQFGPRPGMMGARGQNGQQFGRQVFGGDCMCPDGSTPTFATFPPCSGGPPQGSSCPAPRGRGGQGMMGGPRGQGGIGGPGGMLGGPGGMAGGTGQCERIDGVSALDGGNFVSIVEDEASQTLLVTANGVPHHTVTHSNPNSLCVQTIEARLPLYPRAGATITPVPTRGPIAYALNGVPIFGPQEGGSTNAVEDTFFVTCAGHPSPNGQWHYHHPDIACVGVENQPEKLVGYALDGFGIYGALSGSKADIDAQLDECNGRVVDGQYRYHVRTLDQVDETAPYANPDGSNNWNYVLGCYRGTPFS